MDELIHLLKQLGLGAATRPIYESVMDLDSQAMTRKQFEREIRHILGLHGADACADAILSALAEVNFAGLGASPERQRGRDGNVPEG